jgi:hypothetical protein
MSRRITLAVRVLLAVMAVSLVFVAVRRERLAWLYFSPLADLSGTVVSARLTDPFPMAAGDPRKRDVIVEVPTRLTLELREYPGVRFLVALREEPDAVPPVPAPGEAVTLQLPGRWRDLVAGDRVLAIGLRRGATLLVNPAEYSFADEFRTLFIGVGAALGALIAGIAAWRMRRPSPKG